MCRVVEFKIFKKCSVFPSLTWWDGYLRVSSHPDFFSYFSIGEFISSPLIVSNLLVLWSQRVVSVTPGPQNVRTSSGAPFEASVHACSARPEKGLVFGTWWCHV